MNMAEILGGVTVLEAVTFRYLDPRKPGVQIHIWRATVF